MSKSPAEYPRCFPRPDQTIAGVGRALAAKGGPRASRFSKAVSRKSMNGSRRSTPG